jgi:hypothetical protein
VVLTKTQTRNLDDSVIRHGVDVDSNLCHQRPP